MSEYLDLLIVDNDLVLDLGRQPELVVDRACIAQDIGHMIRDSGLLVSLVAERSNLIKRDYRQQLELLVETDVRLVPGTARVKDLGNGQYLITAKTLQFGDVEVIL
ncbi:hypothetical protein M2401_006218 [Pseudomonas sp. JUb42]|jgi:hypothetical protein|uniref:DUF2590 family protein n=1 Tax=Pseudomonas sp. JUb42 TaxID=2940611 RepID=UPI0021671004|nr:DUF2590 family protein [Pseudomonas sp. JUb42]MCS3472454.1 hypothetical protein [Pseudomonas sp. JUb42]